MLPRVLLGALAAAALVVALPVPALVEFTARLPLEGEDRARDAGGCAPDGEGMEVRPRALSGEVGRGGGLLWFPNEGCWAEWDVQLLVPMRLFVMGEIGYPADSQCGHWDVVIDGAAFAATPQDCSQDGLQLQPVGSSLALPGAHKVRVSSSWTPSWSNGAVDFLEFRTTAP